MSKKNKGGFQNLAAKKFSDTNAVSQYSEDEVYRILRDELPTILKQITNAKSGGQFPEYATNMFANVSAAKFVYEYAELFEKQIRKTGESELMNIDDVKAMRTLVASGFINRNKFQEQQMDEKLRNKLLLKTYKIIDPKMVKKAKKLKLSKKETIELALQVRKDPKYSIERVVKLFDNSTVSKKKKLKVLRKMTGTDKRFAEFIGAALTVNRSVTDFVGMAYDVIMGKKPNKKPNKKMRKYRKPFLRAYAVVFKKRKFFNTILTEDFYQLNKKIIKDLIDEDLGFSKAFKAIKSRGGVKAKTPKSEKMFLDPGKKEKDKKDKKSGKPPVKARVEVPRSMELNEFLKTIKPGGEG